MDKYEYEPLRKYYKKIPLTEEEMDTVNDYYHICRDNLGVELRTYRYLNHTDMWTRICKTIHNYFSYLGYLYGSWETK